MEEEERSMSNGNSAVMAAPTSAVDPVVAEAMTMSARLAPLRAALGLQDFSDQELDLFAMVALRMRMDPFAKQIYAIKRQGKVTFQTGIDGFRSSAEETDQYRGSDEPVYGPMVGNPPHPEWARVVVHRELPDGSRIDQSATAYWDEYVVTGTQGFQWTKMPRVMLAKCAEAAAFRKAFPKRFAQVYESAEMQQADAAEQATPVAPIAHRDRIAAQRAALEAETTSAPASGGTGAIQPEGVTRPASSGDPEPAGSSPSSSAAAGSTAPDDDVIEGVAVDVTDAQAGGVAAGELREWLREHRITIPVAREVCMRMFRIDSFDALTDEQRGHLVLELDAGAKS
jgi:phage recombination protein Bet